jgi:hypothetical protein
MLAVVKEEKAMSKLFVALLAAGLAVPAFAQTSPPAPPAQTTQGNNTECSGANHSFCWQKSQPVTATQPSSHRTAPPALPGANGAASASNGTLSSGAIVGIVIGAVAVVALASGGGGGGHHNGTTGTH